MWEPITFSAISAEISKAEANMQNAMLRFWLSIKIIPEKWNEESFGKEGGGFWVVAVVDSQVVWYNDIEEGFNISTYQTYGTLDEYYCNQFLLTEALFQLANF